MRNRTIERTHLKFFFPFTYKKKDFTALSELLKSNQFEFYTLQQDGLGKEAQLLDQFFYPFIQEKLFYPLPSDNNFNRYKRNFEDGYEAQFNKEKIEFTLKEISIILCPFNSAILSVSIQLENNLKFATVMDFASNFRQLKYNPTLESSFQIIAENEHFSSSESLIIGKYISFIQPFIESKNQNGYVGSLPYFEDERMYTMITMRCLDDDISDNELYRASQLDGTNQNGRLKVSSYNESYIEQYVATHNYDRWRPKLSIITTMQVQAIVTSLQQEDWDEVLLHYNTTLYYNFLIHYFYKVILLKLNYEHSTENWNNDIVIAESIVENITTFSSTLFFKQIAIRSSGRELSNKIRNAFYIDDLYTELKASVNDEYRVLEDENSDRYNQLLFFLTVFTVISGIYGMDLVIESWDKPLKWSALSTMSFFEVIAFFTGLIGIWLSLILVGSTIVRAVVHWIRKRKYKSY